MRYLTERLSENKKPRKYDAEAAHDKVSFIDKHWNIDDEDEYDSDLSEHIRVRLQKLAGTWRKGQRGVPLPDWQKAMKAQWTKSSKTSVAEIYREQNGEEDGEDERRRR
jgi:hypothetical protein